jgi:hypothetical protein
LAIASDLSTTVPLTRSVTAKTRYTGVCETTRRTVTAGVHRCQV